MNINNTTHKSYHKIAILSLTLIILCYILIYFFAPNTMQQDNSSKAYNFLERNTIPQESSPEEHVFFGTWRIEKVAVISKMYTGTTLDGSREEDLYDSADYIGYELEYSSQFFRLGDAKYENPKYAIKYNTVDQVDSGGIFRSPSLYEFIAEEEIKINNEETYTSETPLICFDINFKETIHYEKYDFIPVGTQCVLLNNDTMLVGLWGKILVAYRVK